MSEMSIILIICSVCAFIPAIVFHEVMHGFAAYKLGDSTAKHQGRLSLNPLRHIDMFGTVILPGLLILMGGPVFGYAKPVPYNPNNLKNRRVGDVIVGLAGPFANLLLALLGALLVFLLQGVYVSALSNQLINPSVSLFFVYFYALFLPRFILINLYLMFFNLLPIPPLDGSSIFALLCPRKYLPVYYRVQQYALPIFLIVVFALPYLFHIDLLGWYLSVTAGNLANVLLSWA